MVLRKLRTDHEVMANDNDQSKLSRDTHNVFIYVHIRQLSIYRSIFVKRPEHRCLSRLYFT